MKRKVVLGRLKAFLQGDILHFLRPVKIILDSLGLSLILHRKYPTLEEEFWITLADGMRLYGHIHRPLPLDYIKWPGVILVPPGLIDGGIFDRWYAGNPRAKDIASQGYAVVHFDPEGRGKSDGVEDYGGGAHQNDFRAVLEYFSLLPYVDQGNIGVVSFSFGITMATGGLAKSSDNPKVKYIFDWEGPSNKYEVTRNDQVELFRNYPTSNEFFWVSRQAINYIGEIGCGYFRFQSERDHVLGKYQQHAVGLINGSLKGMAEWVRCNDAEVKFPIDEKRLKRDFWIPYFSNQKLKAIQYINELSGKTNPT